MKNVLLIVIFLIAAIAGYLFFFEPETLDRFKPAKERPPVESTENKSSNRSRADAPPPRTAAPVAKTPAKLTVAMPPISWYINGKELPLENEVSVPAGSGTLTGFTEDGYLHIPLDVKAGESRQVNLTEIRERPASSWQTFQGDGRRAGFAKAATRDSLTPRWQTALGGRVSATPIIAGNVAYVATDKSAAVAVDLTSGDILWKADQSGSDVAPVTNGAYLFTGNDNGQFAGFRTEDGKQKGFTSLGSYPIALAPASEEIFLAVTREHIVYAVATKKSLFGKLPLKIRWETPLPGLSDAAPLILGNKAFFQTRSGLAALDVESGKQLWPVNGGGDAGEAFQEGSMSVIDNNRFRAATPATGNGIIYAVLDDHLTAVSADDGRQLWRAERDDKISSSLSLAHGLIYAGCKGGWLRAFSSHDGRLVFEKKVSEQTIFASPVLFADRLLVATRSGEVLLLHALSGDIIARDKNLSGAPIHATPAVVDGAIVVVNQGGKAICYQ